MIEALRISGDDSRTLETMIYLDYNATTPVDAAVVEAMLPYLREHHGNASSQHAMGRVMRAAVDKARKQVADLLAATPDEIVFTSGGSEANNWALKGLFEKQANKPCHIVTSVVEHPAILNPCVYLERRGCRVTRVPVDGVGMVNPDDVKKAITPGTILITIMHANNEVGTIQPIAEISRIAREHGILLHTDAAQSVGKVKTDVNELGVDFLSMAGHKLYAPTGIGALYMRGGTALEPLIHGAGHEKGRRAGTESVHNIVGLGAAAEIASKDLGMAKTRDQRDRFHGMIADGLGDRVVLNGHPLRRLPNTLNLGFRGLIGPDLLARLDDIAASPGAACHSDRHEPSHVLAAMNVPRDIALGAIRFSLGRPTSDDDITRAAAQIINIVTH